MKLKAIFLDIDNTLLDFDAAAQQSMEESFHKFGLSFHPEMMSIFNEENDKIWQRIEKKELSIADLPHVRWQTILPKLGLQADGEAMEKEFKSRLHTSAVPVEGALEILSYLHEKYMLCAASNLALTVNSLTVWKKRACSVILIIALYLSSWVWKSRRRSFLTAALQSCQESCRRRP